MFNLNYINQDLKSKFKERVLKICIDGSFTCPNRDGSKSSEGCIYCSERGSGEHLSSTLTIREQIEKYFNSYKIERANSFIIYFQNYSNTYDKEQVLKEKYDEAINTFYECSKKLNGSKKLVGLQIATRPDCINDEIANLLFSYKDKLYIAIELGLQTSNDITGALINRCYTSDDFVNAVKILNDYNIDVIAHIMVGLPNETHKDIEKTVSFINKYNIQGLKIHSTYIVKNTLLEKMYLDKKYTPLTLEEYLNELSYILTHVSPNLVIHRISGDAPKDLLVAPDWNLHKKWILNGIYKKFKDENLYQGKYYNE